MGVLLIYRILLIAAQVFYGDDANAKAKLVDDVRECCLHNGFFQIVGHRVPAEVQNDVLESLKSFFSLPQGEKEKVHKGRFPLAASDCCRMLTIDQTTQLGTEATRT
jgi:isopenicillin N synthase-like dioxygenase